MKIDLTHYKKDAETILKTYHEKGLKRCLEISVASSYPLVLVYTILDTEIGGFSDKIEELKKFYGYTEIKY